MQQRIHEKLVEVPVPQVFEDIAELVRLVPRARVQGIDKQLVEVPIPQIVRILSTRANPGEDRSWTCPTSCGTAHARASDHGGNLFSDEANFQRC